MYKGDTINELLQMVERAEDHAHVMHMAEVTLHDEQAFTSRYMCVPDAQPMMIGVA